MSLTEGSERADLKEPTADRPKISVLIHNQNRASYLRHCLESIVTQTYRPLEIIVLDAGSVDASPDVISEFKSRQSEPSLQVRSYSCPLLGVPASRNLAASYANGDILCFIDNDAILFGEGTLKGVVEIYQDNPHLSLVSFQVLLGHSASLDPYSWIYRRNRNKWRDRQFRTFSFTGCGFSIKRSSYRQNRGFWEMLEYSREEEDLALSLINRAEQIMYVPKLMIRHFPDPKGRMSTRQRRFIELKNGTLIYWRRFPFPASVLFITARILSMAIRSVFKEKKTPWYLLPALQQAAREWRNKRPSREPISFSAVARYLGLHFTTWGS